MKIQPDEASRGLGTVYNDTYRKIKMNFRTVVNDFVSWGAPSSQTIIVPKTQPLYIVCS